MTTFDIEHVITISNTIYGVRGGFWCLYAPEEMEAELKIKSTLARLAIYHSEKVPTGGELHPPPKRALQYSTSLQGFYRLHVGPLILGPGACLWVSRRYKTPPSWISPITAVLCNLSHAYLLSFVKLHAEDTVHHRGSSYRVGP